jgi:hypothetical protein
MRTESKYISRKAVLNPPDMQPPGMRAGQNGESALKGAFVG